MLPPNLTIETAFTDDIQRHTTVKLYEIQAVSPFGQFGQDVLNTPLPSLQQLSGSPLLLAQIPQMYKLFPEAQMSTAQSQQPTTIGSLLNSAATSASSFTGMMFRALQKHWLHLLLYYSFRKFLLFHSRKTHNKNNRHSSANHKLRYNYLLVLGNMNTDL